MGRRVKAGEGRALLKGERNNFLGLKQTSEIKNEIRKSKNVFIIGKISDVFSRKTKPMFRFGGFSFLENALVVKFTERFFFSFSSVSALRAVNQGV